MAKKPTYYELLKHPKWQRKRLEILEREDFSCEWCGSKDDTLHVHHGYYEKGNKPWEYPDESLHVYCADCHAEVESVMARIRQSIGTMKLEQLRELAGLVKAHRLLESDPELGPSILVEDYSEAWGAGTVLGVPAEQVIDRLNNGELTQQAFVELAVEVGALVTSSASFQVLRSHYGMVVEK